MRTMRERKREKDERKNEWKYCEKNEWGDLEVEKNRKEKKGYFHCKDT